MRLISQNRDYDVPYDHTALSCEKIDGAECVVARVDGVRYLMGKYNSPDDAKIALEGARGRERAGAVTCYVFPQNE